MAPSTGTSFWQSACNELTFRTTGIKHGRGLRGVLAFGPGTLVRGLRRSSFCLFTHVYFEKAGDELQAGIMGFGGIEEQPSDFE